MKQMQLERIPYERRQGYANDTHPYRHLHSHTTVLIELTQLTVEPGVRPDHPPDCARTASAQRCYKLTSYLTVQLSEPVRVPARPVLQISGGSSHETLLRGAGGPRPERRGRESDGRRGAPH